MTTKWDAMPRALFAAMRHDRVVVLGCLVAVILVAWTYVLLGAGIEMETMDMGGGQVMLMLPEWSAGYALVVLVMWSMMMVAMMLPSVAPITLLLETVARKRAAAESGTAMRPVFFVLGYLTAWFGFSAAATALQWALDSAGLLSETMALGNAVLAGVILVAIGAYQWTPLKQACLHHCRSPLEFLMLHWREGAWGSAESGLRYGLYCLGCCWMLMGLLFVGGIMNLFWIAALALLVLLEKVLPWGRRVSRITGAILVVWGAVTVLNSWR
jgi:predicted metal-binding membrane protein